MTLLADLRHLAQCSADAQFCPNRKLVKLDPFAQDVFGKSAWEKSGTDFLLQAIHTLLTKQADLPMPVTSVGIPVDPMFWPEMDTLDRVLLLPLLLTDTDGFDHGALYIHKRHLRITYLLPCYTCFPRAVKEKPHNLFSASHNAFNTCGSTGMLEV
jgi:hypothetical protein